MGKKKCSSTFPCLGIIGIFIPSLKCVVFRSEYKRGVRLIGCYPESFTTKGPGSGSMCWTASYVLITDSGNEYINV